MTEANQQGGNVLLNKLAVLIPVGLPLLKTPWEYALATIVGAAWADIFPEVEIIWGGDGNHNADDPTSLHYGRAMNNARGQTDREFLMNSDLDHLPPGRWELVAAIKTMINQELDWVRPFRNRRLVDERTTRRYIEDHHTTLEHSEYIGAMAVNIVRSWVWDDINGYDERFRDSGFDNGAFRRKLKTLHPRGRRIGNDGPYVLWRPQAEPDVASDAYRNDSLLLQRYSDATGSTARHIRRMRELADEAVSAVEVIVPAPASQTLGSPTAVQIETAPDPAAQVLTEILSTTTIAGVGVDATGTMAAKPPKTPQAVEGYRVDWSEDQQDRPTDQEEGVQAVELVAAPEDEEEPEDTQS